MKTKYTFECKDVIGCFYIADEQATLIFFSADDDCFDIFWI